MLEKSFGKWTGADVRADFLAGSPVRIAGLFSSIRPGTPQTQVRIMMPGPRRSSPDYESLLVMNEILGRRFLQPHQHEHS